jgi:hypothetical protein
MRFVHSYLTGNIASCYEDRAFIFRETVAVYCEEQTKHSNCLVEEILIYLLLLCLGRFRRVNYLDGYIEPTTWTIASGLYVGSYIDFIF